MSKSPLPKLFSRGATYRNLSLLVCSYIFTDIESIFQICSTNKFVIHVCGALSPAKLCFVSIPSECRTRSKISVQPRHIQYIVEFHRPSISFRHVCTYRNGAFLVGLNTISITKCNYSRLRILNHIEEVMIQLHVDSRTRVNHRTLG